jgi:hypothetical protein
MWRQIFVIPATLAMAIRNVLATRAHIQVARRIHANFAIMMGHANHAMEIAVLSVTAIPVPVMRPTIAKLAMLIHAPVMPLITARPVIPTDANNATAINVLYAIRIDA